jgi:c-di-GMP-binding flagellar brake protein YcgR
MPAGRAVSPPPAQRRDAVRASSASELHIGRPGEKMTRCLSVDYSGSGLRAHLPTLRLADGEEVDVYARMPDGVEIEARAAVVRRDPDGLYAFQFVEIDEQHRELLIRRIFTEQRRRLAAAKEHP